MKQLQTEYVIRIPSHYVGKDCLQIMLPHGINETTTFLNANDIIYHYKENSPRYDNRYLTENRKWQFPYANIPNHFGRSKSGKIKYVNQLLNFNQVYLEITNGLIIERYALKDADEGLVAYKFIIPESGNYKYMTRDELNELINLSKNVFDLDGSLMEHAAIPTEDRQLELYRQWLIEHKKQEQEQRQKQEMWQYGHINSNILDDYFYRSIAKLTINDIPAGTLMTKNLVLLNTNNCEFESVQALNIYYISPDKYKVEFYNYPITKYTLEHMKNIEVTNGFKAREPKFPRMLNSHIDYQEIKKAKKLVRKKTK